jgi:hypothetical protein
VRRRSITLEIQATRWMPELTCNSTENVRS